MFDYSSVGRPGGGGRGYGGGLRGGGGLRADHHTDHAVHVSSGHSRSAIQEASRHDVGTHAPSGLRRPLQRGHPPPVLSSGGLLRTATQCHVTCADDHPWATDWHALLTPGASGE